MEPRFPTPVSPEQMGDRTIELAPVTNPEVKDLKTVSHIPRAEPTVVVPNTDEVKQLAVHQGVDTIDAKKTSNIIPSTDTNELISKDWVDRAKRLVREFKNDPYVLQEQVDNLRNQYLKAKYDKEIGPRA